MSRIALPALISMLTVAAYVGVAQWNVSGEPQQVLTLTERELPLPYTATASDEDPGLQLSIAYEQRNDPLDARNWLPESRLREIGFSLPVPASGPDAAFIYDSVPSRTAWVVFEHDGPAWRAFERRRALTADEDRPPRLRSRLVPVDAGPRADVLRTRYPSGHVILRGVIDLQYVPPERGGPFVYGVLRELVPTSVAVPYEFRPLLRAMLERTAGEVRAPRYEAELGVGRLGLPYIRSVRLAGGN